MDNLSYEGYFLRSWDYIGNDKWRIYYKKDPCYNTCNSSCDGGHGFTFAVIHWVSSNGIGGDIWANDTEVEFSFNGIACFDGVRHMWLATEQEEIFGYINYPFLEDLIEILTEIRNLEITFCSDIT